LYPPRSGATYLNFLGEERAARLQVRTTLHLRRDTQTAAAWAEAENARGHACACGCGTRITVRREHRWKGIPTYVHGHQPMPVQVEMRSIQEEGFLTSWDVANELGIGVTTLFRLEGKAHKPVPRRGKRQIRLYTPAHVAQIRRWLALGRPARGRSGRRRAG
jgi:hypothetical protein